MRFILSVIWSALRFAAVWFFRVVWAVVRFVVDAHWTVLRNFLPRSMVIYELDRERTSYTARK